MSDIKERILVVEDNAALARVIRFNLEGAGFDVTVASDGRAALVAAQNERIDLVITDQQMPLMTGCELCRRLREIPQYANLPIILVTAKGLELELPQLCRELGIAMTFHKPFSPTEVVRAAEECLLAETTPPKE